MSMQPSSEKQEPKYEMTTYYWVFLVTGQNKEPLSQEATTNMQKEHLANLERFWKAGKALLVGPLGDKGVIRGIVVLDVKTAEEAKACFKDDPFVKNDKLAVEACSWYTAKGRIRKPEKFYDLEACYLGILNKGKKWSAEVTPETQEIQTGHIAHLTKMVEMGALALAGPLSDAGDRRGILVFHWNDEKKIKELAEQDPAIKSGRLALELHPLYLAKGSLPEPGK